MRADLADSAARLDILTASAAAIAARLVASAASADARSIRNKHQAHGFYDMHRWAFGPRPAPEGPLVPGQRPAGAKGTKARRLARRVGDILGETCPSRASTGVESGRAAEARLVAPAQAPDTQA